MCCQADKIEQLHETLAARFGVAVVGPAGAGKTVCYTLLAQARSWLWREQHVQQQRQQQQQQQWQQDHSTDDIRSVCMLQRCFPLLCSVVSRRVQAICAGEALLESKLTHAWTCFTVCTHVDSDINAYNVLCGTCRQQIAEQQSPLTQSAYYGNDYTAAAVAAAAASQRTAAGAFAFLDSYGSTTATAAAAAPAGAQQADAMTAAATTNGAVTSSAVVSEWSRVSVAVLNPKAITVGELYGHFNALTQEVITEQTVHTS
jgi:hypothetical protein